MLSFFPRGVLDEILNLIESVSVEFPSYSFIAMILLHFPVYVFFFLLYRDKNDSSSEFFDKVTLFF